MFYHWLAPLGKTYIIFNLFNYISFRAAGATVTALLLAFLVGPPVIARLRARKVGQIIRAEGPASHQSKRGTPTMGGLIIILATVVPTLLWAPLTNRFVVVAMLSILWMACIVSPAASPESRRRRSPPSPTCSGGWTSPRTSTCSTFQAPGSSPYSARRSWARPSGFSGSTPIRPKSSWATRGAWPSVGPSA